MISDKVRPHHLERKALLYVRQSSAHQVLHNRESSALQYAMRDRLTALGWSEIEVIDDDLGRSAAGGVLRAGFERMVAQVCLGKVGAVAAREVSRFARNSRDWQQLIEMCRRYGADRSGDDLCAQARQRSASARSQGQPQRVRARSVAAALALGRYRHGLPGRCPPQDVDLLAEDQVLSFKRCPRSKQANKRPPKQSAKVPHRKPASPNSRSLASRIRFTVGTGAYITESGVEQIETGLAANAAPIAICSGSMLTVSDVVHPPAIHRQHLCRDPA